MSKPYGPYLWVSSHDNPNLAVNLAEHNPLSYDFGQCSYRLSVEGKGAGTLTIRGKGTKIVSDMDYVFSEHEETIDFVVGVDQAILTENAYKNLELSFEGILTELSVTLFPEGLIGPLILDRNRTMFAASCQIGINAANIDKANELKMSLLSSIYSANVIGNEGEIRYTPISYVEVEGFDKTKNDQVVSLGVSGNTCQTVLVLIAVNVNPLPDDYDLIVNFGVLQQGIT